MGSGPSRRLTGRRKLVVLAVAASFAAAACVTHVPQLTYDGSGDPAQRTVVLTPDGFDTYTLTSGSGSARIQARPDNRDTNLREAFWPIDGPEVVDEQSCATWSEATGGETQQGAVLRLSTAFGRVRAVTVTKNIWFYGVWVFNVHVWDTSSLQPFTLVGQVDLRDELYPGGVLQPLPWHLCARVIGSVLDLKVWHGGEAEPAWGDGLHGGTVVLPDGWVYPGRAGWYLGHLGAGDVARFDDLRTWQYVTQPVEPPSTTTTTATTTTAPTTTATSSTTTTATSTTTTSSTTGATSSVPASGPTTAPGSGPTTPAPRVASGPLGTISLG